MLEPFSAVSWNPNFEEDEVSFRDFYKNYKNITDNKLPYIVALGDKKVIGIAYLNKFRDKSGYRFTFENTIYVSNDHIKDGIGSKLLGKLINVSKNRFCCVCLIGTVLVAAGIACTSMMACCRSVD